jgi:hypothetical protein
MTARSTTLSVVSGLLLVIGLFALFAGITVVKHRNDPMLTTNDDIRNTSIRGGYVSPYQADGQRAIARIQVGEETRIGMEILTVGIVLCIPALCVGATVRNRRTRPNPFTGSTWD